MVNSIGTICYKTRSARFYLLITQRQFMFWNFKNVRPFSKSLQIMCIEYACVFLHLSKTTVNDQSLSMIVTWVQVYIVQLLVVQMSSFSQHNPNLNIILTSTQSKTMISWSYRISKSKSTRTKVFVLKPVLKSTSEKRSPDYSDHYTLIASFTIGVHYSA